MHKVKNKNVAEWLPACVFLYYSNITVDVLTVRSILMLWRWYYFEHVYTYWLFNNALVHTYAQDYHMSIAVN